MCLSWGRSREGAAPLFFRPMRPRQPTAAHIGKYYEGRGLPVEEIKTRAGTGFAPPLQHRGERDQRPRFVCRGMTKKCHGRRQMRPFFRHAQIAPAARYSVHDSQMNCRRHSACDSDRQVLLPTTRSLCPSGVTFVNGDFRSQRTGPGL